MAQAKGVQALRESQEGSVRVRIENITHQQAKERMKAELVDGDGERQEAVILAKAMKGSEQQEQSLQSGSMIDVEGWMVSMLDETRQVVLVSKLGQVEDGGEQDAQGKTTATNPKTADEPPDNSPTTKRSRPGAAGTKRITPIQALNPYMTSWTTKARVVSREQKRTFNDKRTNERHSVFSAHMANDDGATIKATFWRGQADALDQVVKEGTMLMLSGGRLRMADKRFSSNDYELNLGEGSTVEDIPEESVSPQSMLRELNPVPISKLGEYAGVKRHIDAIGACVECGDLGTVKRRRDGQELTRKELTLADDSGFKVQLTLWGDLGEKTNCSAGSIVAIRGALVTTFNGASLSSIPGSHVEVDPDYTRANELQSWMDSLDGSLTNQNFRHAGEGLPQGNQGHQSKQSQAPPTSLAAIQRDLGTEEKRLGRVLAWVGHIDPNQAMYYDACPQCRRKVSESLWCERCGEAKSSSDKTYIVRFHALDPSSSSTLMAFRDAVRPTLSNTNNAISPLVSKSDDESIYPQGEEIMAMSADDFSELREENDGRDEAQVRRVLWKRLSFLVSASMERFNNEQRLRMRAIRCYQPDYAAETRRLLAALPKLHE